MVLLEVSAQYAIPRSVAHSVGAIGDTGLHRTQAVIANTTQYCCSPTACDQARSLKSPAKVQKQALTILDMQHDGGTRRDRAHLALEWFGWAVALFLGSFMAVFLFPLAIEQMASVGTDDWTAGAENIWSLGKVVLGLAVFVFFAASAVTLTTER